MAAEKTTALARGDKNTRKRVRSKQPDTPLKKGGQLSLSRILDMPLEVFQMMAAYLEPVDLLSLARSNKPFRAMFMSRSSQRLWQTTIKNIEDLPPCPSELSEPQYASLLWSETCSRCGVRVVRRMDPFLLIRYCDDCRQEELMITNTLDPFINLLVVSEEVEEAEKGDMHTFRSEFYEVKKKRMSLKGKALDDWLTARWRQVQEREKRGLALAQWLKKQDDKQRRELESITNERHEQIKRRLLEKGWTERDMNGLSVNQAKWAKLALQPKPLTDSTWNKLCPQLVQILQANRAHNDEMDKKNRHTERLLKLENLVGEIQAALPPLIHVVLNPDEGRTQPELDDLKVEMPFPTMAELQTWPKLKAMIERDTSPYELETSFVKIREEFDRMVVEWREKIEQDLVDIWNAGRRRESKVDSGVKPSMNKGNGKAKAVEEPKLRRSTRCTKVDTTKRASTSKVDVAADAIEPTADMLDLSLPEFTVTFAKSDGTTTTDISELSANLQVLLRAETIFASKGIDEGTYPSIVPRVFPIGMGPGQLLCGQRWKVSKYSRNEEAATAAKAMLSMIERPDATSAEMKALGQGWKCKRCYRKRTEDLESLARHFSQEQSQYKLAQEKIRRGAKAGHVYNSTHDMGPSCTAPFAELVSPRAAKDYNILNSWVNMQMTICLQCEKMGVLHSRYLQSSVRSIPSPIAEHLRHAHNVVKPVLGIQYRLCERDSDFSDMYEDETEPEESDF